MNHKDEVLKDHELTKISDKPLTYMLHKRKKLKGVIPHLESTMLIFSSEGIIILGDLCPNLHGVISKGNYSLKWFVDTNDYSLAKKF